MDSYSEQNIRRFSAGGAVIVLLVGASVLTGWLFHIPLLKSISPGWVTMKANTALCFLLMGIALLPLSYRRGGRGVRFLSFLIALIGLLTLLEYIFNSDFGIDQLLFKEESTAAGTSHPGRMSPVTAGNFLFIGLSVWMRNKKTGSVEPAQILMSIVFFISLFTVFGYLFHAQSALGISHYTQMALHTAITFILIALCFFSLRPDRGIMKLLLSRTVTGTIVRNMIIPVFILFPVLMYLRLQGEVAGWYDTRFGIALIVILVILLFTVFISAITGRIDKAEEQIKKLNAGLESKVEERTKELQNSEQRLSSIYDTTADIIFVLEVKKNERYKFSSVNKSFQTTTGIPYEAVVGKYVNEIIPQPSLNLVLGKYKEAIREKKIVRWEETSQYPTGLLTGEVSIAPVFDAAGNCVRLIGAVHDITQRKKAEEEIKKLNEELEQKIIERTAQLESANKELESFSYSVSHDLRSPLRAIHGYTKILSEDYIAQLDDEARRLMQHVLSNAKKMGELIDELLTFSRLGKKELHRTNVYMQEMAAAVCGELKRQENSRDIEFRINELPDAETDSVTMKQVWMNLVSNALKFTKEKKRAVIEIGSETKGNEIIYYIRDNGAGFDMKYKDKLFGVFQRLHSEEEFEGTGVGLAIVQRIIAKHGGRVWAEGKTDEGAAFYFSLPRK